ncbi:MAG: DUF4416 family protein [Thermodesulfovibrionales bacterium]|nr:DUF4416 family protein [Thermodesulfovibrionales bacterium]
MGKPANPKPALLFAGVLYSDESYLSKAKKSLLKNFGPAILETPSVSWDYSEYYKEEIGSPIMRTFIFFKELINPAEIANIKLRTNDIEAELSADGKRNVNIDPGYLTLANVVLATTKGYSHRIYLGKGIYGEVTLLYKEKDKTFAPNIFTYSDYHEKNCIEMFLKAREILKNVV